MSILNEQQILERLLHDDPKHRLIITPLIMLEEQFGPTSFDVRLGTDFKVMHRTQVTHVDPIAQPDQLERNMDSLWESIHIRPGEPFILHPGEFALAATLEHVEIPLSLAARLEGRSTWGRLGLQIHATAGFVDPGFKGALTFELSNVSTVPLPLYPGVRIAQLCFFDGEATELAYPSKKWTKYSGKVSTAASAFYRDPEYERLRQYRHSHSNVLATSQ